MDEAVGKYDRLNLVARYNSAVGPHGDLKWCAEAASEIKRLCALVAMMDAVIEGAQLEFVRVPYGASHEDVAAINDWHAMAEECRRAAA